jgi:Mg-chelatase subunit ChlD
VVRKVVDDLEQRLRSPLTQAVRGALAGAARTRRPRSNEIDWPRTVRANLHTFRPGSRTVVPERLVGHARRRSSLRDVVLCVDQSGSMAASVVYASIFAAVLASLRAVTTRMIVFDTAVADLTDDLADPVDLLFGAQLGGGTDIARALGYCQSVIARPLETVLVLVTDLYEGGSVDELLARTRALVASGVHMVCLLSLSDEGAPAYRHDLAAQLAALGVPAFACTPELFPDLMAAAIRREDLGRWASRHEVVAARPEP